MSLKRVEEFTESLPYRLREEVLGYARSVQDALGDIFREARMRSDAELGNQLVFLAGIKKLHAICGGTFWILDNSLTSLAQVDTYEVRVGSLRISRGSKEYRQLRDLLNDIEVVLAQHEITELVQLRSYAEILRLLRNERRQR
jgi:hypothetical protein